MRPWFALLLLGWLTLSVAFIVSEVWMRGTAQNGKVESGRFYVGQHGQYHEVSRVVYMASAIGTWVWGFYAVVVAVCGMFQSRPERLPRFAPLLAMIVILFLGGIMAALSYSTFNCLMSASRNA
jgi:hypothetical protein